jgi:glycerate kinase
VESAGAIGLARLAAGERDPLRASSAGLAGLLRAAAAVGPREIVVGLGGSATVDGGWGLAAALGFGFAAEGGGAVASPADLGRLARIEPPPAPALPAGIQLVALADVASPLLGPRGAAAVFGPQKGAGPAAVEALERGLERLAQRWTADLGAPRDLASQAGAGAAGGLGAGLAAFLGAELEPGAAAVARWVGLEAALERADAVVTGEGRWDEQSAAGKATGTVVAAARARGLPVAVICAEAPGRPPGPGVMIFDGRDLAPRPPGPLGAAELADLAALAADRLASAAAGP